MKVTVKVDGLRDLDAALGQLTKATARNTLKRVLKMAGQPIADAARLNAPFKSGELKESIQVSPKIKNAVGKAEFAAAMRAGLGKAAAVEALREARRGTAGSFAVMHVGPAQAKSKADAIKRIVQEFGSVKQAPNPYMRPAWDAEQGVALEIIKDKMGSEIQKAAERARVRAARKAAK